MTPFQITPRLMTLSLHFDLEAKNNFLYFVAAEGMVFHKHILIFSSPEPKAQVSYCHRAPSVVCPSSSSVVVRKLSHFQLLLQNRLMDFDETWYA